MLVNDVQGKYKINFDEASGVSYETPQGFWTKEDYLRYHNDYVTKIGPTLKGRKWAKCVDTRNYSTSDITDEMGMHSEWMANNGASHAAIIVESAIVKMQINRAVSGKFKQQAFTSENEAQAWLKANGF